MIKPRPITPEQIAALNRAAEAFGWDEWTAEDLVVLLQALFHYCATRL